MSSSAGKYGSCAHLFLRAEIDMYRADVVVVRQLSVAHAPHAHIHERTGKVIWTPSMMDGDNNISKQTFIFCFNCLKP